MSQRQVARQFRVSLHTVQYWLARAGKQRLDRVDFGDHSSRPSKLATKTPHELELHILELREQLQSLSDLGEHGALAIHRALLEEGRTDAPSVRTINRVLERHGKFDHRRRVRRPAPPIGWYVPELRARRAELDEIDIVEGLRIKDGPLVEVLNIVSLHGGLPGSRVQTASIKATDVVATLIEHWRAHGLPQYAQFDNDPVFKGPPHRKDVVSRVTRLCLSLGVIPVFAIPREHGWQAAIESYNGRWQQKVWLRFTHASLQALSACSERFVRALRQRLRQRIESAPARRSFPSDWNFDVQQHPRGTMIFLRRSTEDGSIELLGHRFQLQESWSTRIVRCDVDLTAGKIRFYALRRSEPEQHRLIGEAEYILPQRRFRE